MTEEIVDRPSMTDQVISGGTEAASPGGVRVEPGLYYRCFPFWPTLWFIAFITSVPTAILIGGWKIWVPVMALLLTNLFYWLQVRAHFRSGNVVACKLISESPYRFAAITDLTMKEGDSYPAVKVFSQPISRMTPPIPREGERCAAVATYRQKPRETKRWVDFYPKLVNAASSDPAEVERVLNLLPEEDWEELDGALTLLQTKKRPHKKGLRLLR